MEINLQKNNGRIVITIDGRLDTVTSVEFNEFVEKSKDEIASASENVVAIDCMNLEYISSAGLRALLALKKLLSQSGKTLEVDNINNVVREVFDVTGFSKMVKIN